MTDMFGHGRIVLRIVLQHHAPVHIEHVVAHLTLTDQFMTTQHFHGHKDVGEGMQCLHTQFHIIDAADLPCHISASVIQIHNIIYNLVIYPAASRTPCQPSNPSTLNSNLNPFRSRVHRRWWCRYEPSCFHAPAQ